MDSQRPEFTSTPLAPDQIDLLQGLIAPVPLEPVAHFDGHDVLFLEGIAKRMRTTALEISMLPEASLRLSEMLRHGDRPVAQYVDLISKDAALSVEVLRVANSAAYASAPRTGSLQDAVMRVGLARLQSVLMMTLMKARVMKLGSMQGRADALLELALPIGFVASALARLQRKPADACFTRGMLLHVEHLLILGLIPAIARENRVTMTVSNRALLQAFARYGPEIRASAAKAWKLADLLSATADGDATDYALVRRAVVHCWLGMPMCAMAGAGPEVLEAVTQDLHLRVSPEFGEQAAGTSGVTETDKNWLEAFLRAHEQPASTSRS